MQASKWIFRPGIMPTLATLAVFPLLLALGFWQLDRADQKQQLFETYIERTRLEPVDLNREVSLRDRRDEMLWRQSIVDGHYTGDRVFLLDNQVLNGTPGYFVFAPFEIGETDNWVIINRGWVSAGNYRDQVPDIKTTTERVVINGVAQPPPPIPVFLAGESEEKMGPGIIRIQNIRLDILEDMFKHKLLPYVIRLEPSSPTGYMREWPEPGSGKERHLGYAFQWFALAAALMAIYFFVNARREIVE